MKNKKKQTFERLRTFQESKDPKERREALREEVLELLISLANQYTSYQVAIDITQTWLKAYAKQFPGQKQLIEDIANEAGDIFLKEVRQAQMLEKIRRGEMPITLKSVSGS